MVSTFGSFSCIYNLDCLFFIGSQINYRLRQRAARTKGPDAERFQRLANSLEEFTYCLLDPLKTDTHQYEGFGTFLDDLLNHAIEFEQKKVASKKRNSPKTPYEEYFGKFKPLVDSR